MGEEPGRQDMAAAGGADGQGHAAAAREDGLHDPAEGSGFKMPWGTLPARSIPTGRELNRKCRMDAFVIGATVPQGSWGRKIRQPQKPLLVGDGVVFLEIAAVGGIDKRDIKATVFRVGPGDGMVEGGDEGFVVVHELDDGQGEIGAIFQRERRVA